MIFQAVGLNKYYQKRPVVRELSFSIKRGEVVGLLGPNGAGKTTTFNMMVGLLDPDSGGIFLGSEEITQMPMFLRARMGISYLPQEPSIFRKLTVMENLLAILETQDSTQGQRQEKADTLLANFNLTHLSTHKAYTLSGGECRRVEIARALTTAPRYILLDEPFAGIDPIAVKEIQEIIGHLKEQDIGVLITDQNVQETLKITDRAYVINEGQILASGTPQEIVADPKTRVVYLGERFSLDPVE